MRNYEEDIPPWKKEVLMRRDGLSKAVEKDTSILDLEDRIKSPARKVYDSKQLRYRIGSSSSFLSKVINVFADERQSEPQRGTRISTGTHDTGTVCFFYDKISCF